MSFLIDLDIFQRFGFVAKSNRFAVDGNGGCRVRPCTRLCAHRVQQRGVVAQIPRIAEFKSRKEYGGITPPSTVEAHKLSTPSAT